MCVCLHARPRNTHELMVITNENEIGPQRSEIECDITLVSFAKQITKTKKTLKIEF